VATDGRLVKAGARVALIDDAKVSAEVGEAAWFVPGDVTDEESFAVALDAADARVGRLRDDVRAGLAAGVPGTPRLGSPDEFGQLACRVLENAYLNGETIRLDGAIRMTPR
jgi:NAD(P)-dependent dehydrogenase (short-subunit alcohol dehydrogenase family)